MTIIEKLINEKKYITNLNEKSISLSIYKKSLIQDKKTLEKALNDAYKEKFEIKSEIKHYEDVNKIITFQTILKLLISLIITILVIKYIPPFFSRLWQNIILIPFYFYISYTWVKNTEQEFTFKNAFNITKKKLTIDNLSTKINKLEDKILKINTKIDNITTFLKKITDEENIHKTYYHTLEEILNNYYYKYLQNYLSPKILENITYPKSPTLKLEKEID